MARTVRRKPLDVRWSQDEVQAIRGSTWSPAPGIDVSLQPTVVVSPAGEQWDSAKPAEITQPGMKARRARLRPAEFAQHGYTLHWDGCRAIREKMPPRNHNEICRARMEEAIGNDDEGRERMEAGYIRMADAHMRREAARGSVDVDT